jgi:hypothetical protein
VWGLLPLVLLLAGCGAEPGGTPTNGPIPTPAPSDVTPVAPTLPALTDATPALTPAPALTDATPAAIAGNQYAYAPDYAWIAGQVRQEGECWIVTYISPMVDRAPDEYNNRLGLLPGSWDASLLSDGAWVVVQGDPATGADPAPGCTAHGYRVISLRIQPPGVNQ